MNTKQILRSLPLIAVASVSLSFILVSPTFALSKKEFAGVVCSGKKGQAAKDCEAAAIKDGKATVKGKVFKFNDSKSLSKADFRNEVNTKTAATAPATPTTGPSSNPSSASGTATASVSGEGCAGADTAIIKCDATGKGTDLKNNGVWVLLLMAINIMTAGVGVLAVGGLAYGALLWTTAGGNSSQITKSKEVMFNVVLGIVSFALMYALLQFLIPGGVFS